MKSILFSLLLISMSVAGQVNRELVPSNFGLTYGGYTAQKFSETINTFNNVNPSGRPNVVYMLGYNQNGGGGRTSTLDASLHLALESHFESSGDLMEFHLQYETMYGQMERALSYTINKYNGANTVYFTTNAFDFRLPGSRQTYMSGGLGNMTVWGNGSSSLHLNDGIRAVKFQAVGGNLMMGDANDLYFNADRFISLPRWVRFNTGGSGWTGGNIYIDLPAAGTSFIFHDHTQRPLFKINSDGIYLLGTAAGALHVDGSGRLYTQ